MGELFEHCLPEDLIQYGLIPEFIGRLPVMSAIHQLSRDELMKILTEPRNALVKQFQRFFQFDGIELVFADEALTSIADKALERETGARGLRSIIEEILLEVQFELPSRRDVKKCVVTKETIEKGLSPTLVTVAVIVACASNCCFAWWRDCASDSTAVYASAFRARGIRSVKPCSRTSPSARSRRPDAAGPSRRICEVPAVISASLNPFPASSRASRSASLTSW